MKHVNFFNMMLVGLLCISCQPDTVCHETRKVAMHCHFREYYRVPSNVQLNVRTEWDSITVQGIGSDSVLYNNTKQVSHIALPLKDSVDTCAYVLTYHQKNDTLTAIYTNQQKFLSIECGCVYNHKIMQINHTRNWIDTVLIVNDAVMLDIDKNIVLQRTKPDNE